jgi:hypothetical protein
MQITVEVPDWALDRHLYFFAGMELFAAKPYGKPLRVKLNQCDWCGRCCYLDDGRCPHLKLIGTHEECELGIMRPFACVVFDPASDCPMDYANCCIRYKEVE